MNGFVSLCALSRECHPRVTDITQAERKNAHPLKFGDVRCSDPRPLWRSRLLSQCRLLQMQNKAILAGHVAYPGADFHRCSRGLPRPISKSPASSRRANASMLSARLKDNRRGRPTGVKLPFKGQPAQGHSGIKARMADGTLLGAAPTMVSAARPIHLMRCCSLNQFRLNWDNGSADRLTTVVPERSRQEGAVPHRQ